MDYRGVVLTVAVLGSALVAISACDHPDPGEITFAERPGEPGLPQGSTSSGTSGSTSSTTSTGGVDSGPAADPIFGTTTFAHVDPGQIANGANAAHGGSVEGKDCVVGGCHGAGSAKQWLMGGTVYSTLQGGATVPKAEIKIVGPANEEVAQAYTDANGNFWLEAQGKTIPQGAKVGARREGGTGSKVMLTALAPTNGGCSNVTGCHGTALTGKVFVP